MATLFHVVGLVVTACVIPSCIWGPSGGDRRFATPWHCLPRRGIWQFWGFAPRTSEIHNFRIRTPFSTFFISPRRWDYALQLSFRLHWLILTLFLIYYKYITYILSLVGRDRKTPFEIHNSFIWTPFSSVFLSLEYYWWDLQFSFRKFWLNIARSHIRTSGCTLLSRNFEKS